MHCLEPSKGRPGYVIPDDSKAFCDGIRVHLLNISKTVAANTERILLDDLNMGMQGLTFKKLLFRACGYGKVAISGLSLFPTRPCLIRTSFRIP